MHQRVEYQVLIVWLTLPVLQNQLAVENLNDLATVSSHLAACKIHVVGDTDVNHAGIQSSMPLATHKVALGHHVALLVQLSQAVPSFDLSNNKEVSHPIALLAHQVGRPDSIVESEDVLAGLPSD